MQGTMLEPLSNSLQGNSFVVELFKDMRERAYDRAAIKFWELDAEINFNLSD
eukprot:c43008_g1_i1 orf=338-493(+)